MHVLALDTTTRAGSVAIVVGAHVLIEEIGDASRSHAERLPSALIDCLSRAGLTTADIDCFAVAAGPGSFTGLRIGIATIQGLAFVHGKPVVGVSALLALAQQGASGLRPGSQVAAWMDAHRRDVFSALYRVGGPRPDGLVSLVELEGPIVGPPAGTLARWNAGGWLPDAICGDGGVLYKDVVPSGTRIAPCDPLAGTIGRIAAAEAAEGRATHPAAVQPLYVRRPDAEIARDAARAQAS